MLQHFTKDAVSKMKLKLTEIENAENRFKVREEVSPIGRLNNDNLPKRRRPNDASDQTSFVEREESYQEILERERRKREEQEVKDYQVLYFLFKIELIENSC
jgi:hypothetical protein